MRVKVMLVALAFPALLGAGKGSDSEVRASAETYFKHTDATDWKAAYGDLCADDRATVTAEQYAARYGTLNTPLAKILLTTATHKIKGVSIDGDAATVTTENTFLDESALMDHATAKGLDPESDDPDMKKRTDDAMLAEARTKHPPMKTKEGMLRLRHESGGWKVDEGLKKEYQLGPSFRKGEELWKAGKLAEARRQYQEILAIDPGNKSARFWIEQIDEKLKK